MLLATLTINASAEGMYVGFKFMRMDTTISAPGFPEISASPTGFVVVIANELSPSMAIEATALLYGRTDKFGDTVSGTDYGIRLDSLLGIGLIGKTSVVSDFQIFGKAGLVDAAFIDTDGHKDSDKGVSFGGGFLFELNPPNRIVLEYESFLDSINLGVQIRF